MASNNEREKSRETPLGTLRLAMVVQFAAVGAVLPFFSMLLRDRGLDYRQISLVLSAAAAVSLAAPFFWGMLADRFIPLNRLFLLINLTAVAALMALTTHPAYGGILVAYVLYTAAVNPTFNLINALGFHHLTNPREEFSLLRAWGSLGWIIPFAPIALWTAFYPQAGLDFTLHLGMAICLGMAVFSFYLPHTPPGARHQGLSAGQVEAYLPAVRRLLHNPHYLVLLVSMFLMSGSFSLVMFYSPPFLEELGVPRPWIGPVQAIGVIFEIVLFFGQPALIRRWNYSGSILVGCSALVLRNLLFSCLDNVWVLAASYLLCGAVIVFYHMGISMLANCIAAAEVRSTAQTLLAICSQGLGPLFANWMAGRLSAAYHDSLRPVFVLAMFLAMLTFFLLAVCGRQLNRAGSRR